MPYPNVKPGCSESRARRSDTDDSFAWRHGLPAEWRDMVVAPLILETYRDYEMPAERRLGYDEDRQVCYIRSSFIVTETRSDDDEEYYQAASHAEIMTAWRLRDERWLVHRTISREGEQAHAFYSFSERMPR